MNELGINLLWSGVEGTMVLGVAALMYCRASRHGPRAAAWVAGAALIVLVLVVPLALCPLPSWRLWPVQAISDNTEAANSATEIDRVQQAANDAMAPES